MSIRVEREIPASKESVWRELSNLADHPTWMKDAMAIEFLGNSTAGIGTRMLVPTRVGPFRTTDVLEITSWDEGNSIGVVHQGMVSGHGEFRLVGDSPTTIVWEEELTFPWWLGGPVTAFIARPILRRIWAGNLRRFAARLAI